MTFDAEAGTVTAVLGPTNTGKTHYAIERMLARESGIIGLPLRLLAREVYDRIVALRGPAAVSLITGEEKIAPPRARYHVCTVEAMPLGLPVDFVAVDEIQLCTDPDRGHVFTDRLLHARGRYETLLLGSDTMRGRIASLVPGVRHHGRTRFSSLTWTGSKKLSRLKPRTAVVAFSVDQVYAIAELIRRQRGGAAVVMGALSPRTRNAQVALYQEGDVDYMVATDAIGMGLNMDVDHVAFAGTAKFDGWRHRGLEANELAQIAGRAGRYTKDGTFGVTGEAPPLEPEVIEAIEEHRFRPAGKLMWRNPELRFHSVEALLASLDVSPGRPDLMRAREAEDQAVLRALWDEPAIRAVATRGDRVRLLWDACQIPDFRKVSPGEHATLVGRIYHFLLTDAGCIPSDWLAGQIGRLDRVHGDIDALSKRLAFIRTWTYVANRPGWVEDAARWREETRAVEDRLSDALHERLTQRFVDRRTSVLMRRLKQKERLVAEVNDKGEVSAEGHFLGRLTGFRFAIDETASGDELKTLRSASLSAVGAELGRRADKLYLSPDTEIDVTDQGGLMWGSDAVGRLSKGDDSLAPRITVFVDEMAPPEVAEKVERRLRHWLGRRVNALFEPMLSMRDDEAITGLARGVAFRLAENFGIIPRREIGDDIKALEQGDRALLRKHGVRFGQHFVFMPALLKPAPTRLRLLLWSLAQGLEEFPDAPPAGHVTVTIGKGAPEGYYHMAGYRPAGTRAVRIDMLERLADLIRPLDARAGFEATQDMLSITGLGHEQFAELMTGLGYQVDKGERPRQQKPQRGASAAKGGAAARRGAAESATPDEAAAAAGSPESQAAAELVAREAAEQGIETLPVANAMAAEEMAGEVGAQDALDQALDDGGDETAGTIVAPPDGMTADLAAAVGADGGAGTAGNRPGDGDQLAAQPAGAETGMPPADPALERNAPLNAEAAAPSGTTAPADAAPGPEAGETADADTAQAGGGSQAGALSGEGGAADGEAGRADAAPQADDAHAGGVAGEAAGGMAGLVGAASQAGDVVGEAADGEAGQVDAAPQAGDADAAGDGVGEAAVGEAGQPGDADPASAGELETFYTFRIRPRNRGPRPAQGDGGDRRRPRRQDAPAAATVGEPRQDGGGGERRGRPGGKRPERDGERGNAGQGKRPERDGERGNAGQGNRPGGERQGNRPERAEGDRPRGKGGPNGKRDRPEDKPRQYEARPARSEKPVDPDSPFAILQQLKNR